MSSPVDINLEKHQGFLFVSGSWFLGELRLSFDELGDYVKESGYSEIVISESDTRCHSCHRYPNEVDKDLSLFEMDLGGSSSYPTICEDCKELFIDNITYFIENNATEISIQSL